MRIPWHTMLLMLAGCSASLLPGVLGAQDPPGQNTANQLASIRSARLIGEINIHGNYPLLEQQVRRQLAIRPGDPFDLASVGAQRERLRAYFERLGYFGTAVAVSHRWRPYTKEMRIDYTIRKGHKLRWGTLHVAENTVLTPEHIRTFFSSWRTYSPKRLREGMRGLAGAYHRRGYARARVRLVRKITDKARGRLDLKLRVIQGPHITVHFEGNKHLTDADLKRTITFFREGRFDSFEIDTSVDAMRRYYLERGFPEPHITAERTRHDDTRWGVAFHIVEGPRRTIWAVRFSGNDHLSHTALRRQILSRPLSLYDRGTLKPAVLEEDLIALRDYYREQGFLDVIVGPDAVTTHQAGRFFTIDIPIQEGPRYTVGAVTFDRDTPLHPANMLPLLQLGDGKPANLSLAEGDRQSVLLHYNDHGYPYATVRQTVRTDQKTAQVHVHYDATPGPLVHIGEILVTGDFLTSQKTIHNAMALRSGDRYSDKLILESLGNLRRLGAFRNVTIDRLGLADREAVVHLAVRIEEEKPFFVDMDIGYTTDDSFTGSVRFMNINSFGWAKRSHFLLLGGSRRARGELGWIDPRFLNTDLLLTGGGWIDRNKDTAFDLIQAAGSTGLYRQYHRTGFHVRYQMARNRLLNANGLAAEGLRDTTLSQFSNGVSYDTRNNYSNPTRGVYLFAQADLTNELKGLRADFVKLHGGVSHYWHLGRGIVLGQYARAGTIQAIGPADIPITERFFLGGDDTLRGFDEDGIGARTSVGGPRGANARWIYNAELTFPLGESLRVATFFDAGSLADKIDALTGAAIRESAGLGLRYLTPIGPLRADYGFKLDRQGGESRDRFHFTFGYVF